MDPPPLPQRKKKRKDYSVGNVCFSNDYEIDLIKMRNLMQRKYLAEAREGGSVPSKQCPFSAI